MQFVNNITIEGFVKSLEYAAPSVTLKYLLS